MQTELGVKLLSQMLQPLPISLPKCSTIIVSGFPYDEGTRRNNGRVGGAVAPMKFRQSLSKSQLYSSDSIHLYDAQDIKQDEQLQSAHTVLQQKHYNLLGLSNDSLVFAIGGSNDQSYPNAKALMRRYSSIGVINIDAHFDVRPLKEGKPHSGSPFRLLLDDEMFKGSKFVEFACKGASTSKAHYQYLVQKNVPIYWMETNIRRYNVKDKKDSECRTQGGLCFQQILSGLSKEVEAIFVSFDSDAISSRWMPGVSAPSVVGGLTAEEACQIMAVSGACSKVKIVDCSEFNPAVEWFFSGQLLVEMFHALVQGVAKRDKIQ